MSNHTADRMPTVPHGTIVYDSKANALCFNPRGRVTCPQPGRSYWINENGQAIGAVAVDKGVLKYKPSPVQSSPPFVPALCAT